LQMNFTCPLAVAAVVIPEMPEGVRALGWYGFIAVANEFRWTALEWDDNPEEN